MQKIRSVYDLLRRILHWWSPITTYIHGRNGYRRIFDKIVHEVDSRYIPIAGDRPYTRSPRSRHAVVTRDPDMVFLYTVQYLQYVISLMSFVFVSTTASMI
jgi:hypothetical protein